MRSTIVVRIDVETFEKLKQFVKEKIGINDKQIYNIIVKKAVRFAISNEEEFKKFLKESN